MVTSPPETEFASADGRAPAWVPGEVLLGLYDVLRILGEGGMGIVHEVRHRSWNLHLAVKSPLPAVVDAAGGRESFIRECETWVELGSYPHIVSCFYVRVVDELPRVFVELVDGGTLHEAVASRSLYAGTTAEALARMLDIAIQCAWGLEYTHRHGVVHKDVKPSNVLLGQGGIAKITDFGLAGAVGGTPAYLSPEQAEVLAGRLPAEALTPRTDVWSWAVAVLEMFAGECPSPYGGQAAAAALEAHLRHGSDGLPPMSDAVAAILRRCLQWDAADRPESLAEPANALAEAYQSLAGRPYRRPKPPLTRSRADLLNNRGVSLLDLGRPMQAIAAWEEAIADDPQHLGATFNLFHRRWREGEIGEDEFLERMCALENGNSGNIDYWRSLCRVHLHRGDDAAIERIEQAHPGAVDDELRHLLQDEERLRVIRAAGELVQFAPDGSVLTTDRRSLCRRDAETDAEIVRVDEPNVESLLVSPDSRYFFTRGTSDSVITLWDARTGARLHELPGRRVRREPQRMAGGVLPSHYDVIRHLFPLDGGCVSFSPDSRRVAVLHEDGGISIRNLPAMEEVFRCDGAIYIGRYSPDGSLLFTGSEDHRIAVLDAATGAERWRFDEHSGPVDDLRFSPDGRLVLSRHRTRKGMIRVRAYLLWDIDQRRVRATFAENADEIAMSPWREGGGPRVGFSPSGRWIYHERDGSFLYDVETGTETALGPFDRPAWCFSRDERQLFIGRDGDVLVLDPGTGKTMGHLPGRNGVADLHLSPDGRFALRVGYRDATLWDVTSVRSICSLRTDRARAAFSADGRTARIAGWRVVLPPPTRSAARAWPPLLSRVRDAAAIAAEASAVAETLADARRLIDGGAYAEAYDALRTAQGRTGYDRDHEILTLINECAAKARWRPTALRGIWSKYSIALELDEAPEVRFLPDARQAAVVSRGQMRVCDIASGRVIRAPYSVPIDERRMHGGSIVTEEGGTLVVRDVSIWSSRARIATGARPLGCIAFSHDGSSIVAADGSTLLLCDVAAAAVRRIDARQGSITSAAFSSDDQLVLTTGEDHSVRLWDVSAGREILRVSAETAAISLDKTLLATWGNGALSIRSAADGSELRRLDDVPGAKWLQFVAGDRWIASGDGRRVSLWDSEGRRRIDCGEEVRNQPPLRDAVLAVRSSSRYQTEVWMVSPASPEGRCIAALHEYHGQVSAALSPDGSELLTTRYDGTVRRWSIATATELDQWPAEMSVSGLAFSRDGRYALWGDGKRFVAHELAGRRHSRRFDQPSIRSFAVSPDARHIVCVSGDEAVVLDDAGVRIATFKPATAVEKPHMYAAGFSGDGARLVWSDGWTLGFVDTTTWKEEEQLAVCRERPPLRTMREDFRYAWKHWGLRDLGGLRRLFVHCRRMRRLGRALEYVAVSPDGSTVAGSSLFALIVWRRRRWRAALGMRSWSEAYRRPIAGPRDVRFSADGRLLLSISDSGVQVWRASDGAEVTQFETRPHGLVGGGFCSGGEFVAAAAATNDEDLLCAWNVATRQEVARIAGAYGGFYRADVSPDGRYILAGCRDDAVRIWELDWEWSR